MLNQLCEVTSANDRNKRDITVLLASPRSFCAGVQRAVAVVESALCEADGPVYVRKQIVHNARVVTDLTAQGAMFVDELNQIPDPPPQGAVVVFSAHGVSPAVRAEADRRQLRVIDATCPLVTKVHSEAARFAGRGDIIVLIGHAGHEEVEGTLGVAPSATVLVQSVEDVAALDLPAGRQVTYLTQTTLSVDETASVIEALRARYPSLREPPSDDICYATTNRQRALRAVTGEADMVLVIGSSNSSNSQRLVEVARRDGVSAHLIDGPGDIDPAWLDNASVVAVTAGASAPMVLVREVVDALGVYGSARVIEREVTSETMRFALPRTRNPKEPITTVPAASRREQ